MIPTSFIDAIVCAIMAKNESDIKKGFEPNPERIDAFIQLVRFFVRLCDDHDGEFDRQAALPHNTAGYITVRFKKLVLKGKQLSSFAIALEACSAFDMSYETTGKVCISFTFPKVFRVKQN